MSKSKHNGFLNKHLNWQRKIDKLLNAKDGSFEAENQELRELYAYAHYCVKKHNILCLYMDDGEIQCGNCLTDFKRDSVEIIKKKIVNRVQQDIPPTDAEK